MPGRLFLCATPIGNLGDASPRLSQVLADADVVYAEDTRRSGKLMTALGIEARLRSFFVGNERRRVADLEADLQRGLDVAVITDAGAPAVSDPGTVAVKAARRAEAEVIVVPGPSAVTAAVTGSGLVDGPFVFEGFLARKGSERSDQLAGIASETRPSVVFLSPHRARADLEDLAGKCGGGREVCVARELTKVHEEFWWGTLDEAVARWQDDAPRGEITIVVAGAEASPGDPGEAVARAKRLMEGGLSASQAAREAAAGTGVSRRAIYDELVR